MGLPVPSTSASGGVQASGDPAVDAIYDAVEAQVVAIRGLQPKRTVDRQFIDRTELGRSSPRSSIRTPRRPISASERLQGALGLIPASTSLRQLNLDLLSGSVAAFYRADESKLYVVSKTGQPGPTERFYFSHEYDHALQDQNSTIFKDFDKVLDQGDQLLARQSIYEGDATLLMTQWAAANLSQAELLDVLTAGADPAAQAALAGTPAILREALTFPYTIGFGYVSNVQSTGGWPAVNAYFTKMPKSTEQILHPEKYAADEAPIAVALPADLATRLGSGWTVPAQDTFGEFQIGIWLRESGWPAPTTARPPAGAGTGSPSSRARAAPGRSPSRPPGTATPMPRSSRPPRRRPRPRRPGRLMSSPRVGGKTRWFLVSSDAATLGRVAGALGLAGLAQPGGRADDPATSTRAPRSPAASARSPA